MRRCADIEAEWEELALRLDAPPFLRPGWIRAWHAAFGRGESEALAVSVGDELQGVAPISRAGRRIHSPTNWHTPFFGVLSAEGATHRLLAKALLERNRRRLEFRFLDRDDRLLDHLRSDAGDRGMSTHERVIACSPYVPVRGTWADYEAGLSKSLRKNLGRRRRRLETLGSVSFTLHQGAEELDRHLADAFRIEASGWKGERGTAMASRDDTRSFYTQVAHWAAQTGSLRLAFLRLNGVPIAFDFALESGRVHYSLKSGYEASCREFGPGSELTRALIERAFDQGLDRFDLLGSTDAFKRLWAGDHSRELVAFQAYAPGLLGAADRLVQCQGRDIAKRVRARLARASTVATNVLITTSEGFVEAGGPAYVPVG